jgi:hypothetical protein
MKKDELSEAIEKRAQMAEARMARLHHALSQPVSSDLERERFVEVATRALRWAYLALAGNAGAAAFADAFYSYVDLMYADSMYSSDVREQEQLGAESLVEMHDQAYDRVLQCDAVIVGPVGQEAIRKSGQFFDSLNGDDKVRTLANWLILILNGRFLTYVNPVILPELMLQCTVLCTDLEIESKGGTLPGSKIALDRADLRRTLMAVIGEVKPLIDAGHLVYCEGGLVRRE